MIKIHKEKGKKIEKFLKSLIIKELIFQFQKKDYGKIEVLNGTNFNVFCYENKIIYPVYLSDQIFDDCLDLLLISNNFTSYYVYIKHFNRFMFNKTKHKGKKYFCKSCLQCFSSKKTLIEHKEDCLMINGKQNVKLEKEFISFKNFNKKIPVPFKIYAHFEYILKSRDVGIDDECFSMFLNIQENIKAIFLVVLLIKLFVLMINLVKILCCIEKKMQFLKRFL